MIDVWLRQKKGDNIIVNDPKGGAPRSIVKSYRLQLVKVICRELNFQIQKWWGNALKLYPWDSDMRVYQVKDKWVWSSVKSAEEKLSLEM